MATTITNMRRSVAQQRGWTRAAAQMSLWARLFAPALVAGLVAALANVLVVFIPDPRYLYYLSGLDALVFPLPWLLVTVGGMFTIQRLRAAGRAGRIRAIVGLVAAGLLVSGSILAGIAFGGGAACTGTFDPTCRATDFTTIYLYFLGLAASVAGLAAALFPTRNSWTADVPRHAGWIAGVLVGVLSFIVAGTSLRYAIAGTSHDAIALAADYQADFYDFAPLVILFGMAAGLVTVRSAGKLGRARRIALIVGLAAAGLWLLGVVATPTIQKGLTFNQEDGFSNFMALLLLVALVLCVVAVLLTLANPSVAGSAGRSSAIAGLLAGGIFCGGCVIAEAATTDQITIVNLLNGEATAVVNVLIVFWVLVVAIFLGATSGSLVARQPRFARRAIRIGAVAGMLAGVLFLLGCVAAGIAQGYQNYDLSFGCHPDGFYGSCAQQNYPSLGSAISAMLSPFAIAGGIGILLCVAASVIAAVLTSRNVRPLPSLQSPFDR